MALKNKGESLVQVCRFSSCHCPHSFALSARQVLLMGNQFFANLIFSYCQIGSGEKTLLRSQSFPVT
jgi:hypothetical protein